jgi:DNA-binding response OmpR family regulator
MRCLFVVDEIARYREVAVALDAQDSAMTMVKDFALAERIAQQGRFDLVLVGTNSFASDSMRFLQSRRERRCPVVAVTCEPGLRRELFDSGADRVVLLPDDAGELKRAFAGLITKPSQVPPQSGKRSRLWQHFGL